jgi:hypothetical protein
MRWLLPVLALLALACGPTTPQPPTPKEDHSLLSQALGRDPAPEAPKEEAELPEPPAEASPTRDAPTAPSSEDTSPACKAAKAKREKQEKRIYDKRVAVVDASDARLATAQSSMTRCISDLECATDGKRVMELQERIASAEANFEAALDAVGVLEAELFTIDEEIRAACGRESH